MDNFSQKYILWDLDGTIVESENSDFKREIIPISFILIRSIF